MSEKSFQEALSEDLSEFSDRLHNTMLLLPRLISKQRTREMAIINTKLEEAEMWLEKILKNRRK